LKDFKETTIYSDSHRVALLDLLLKTHIDDPDKFTADDVRNEVNTFVLGGHDTTSTSLLWFLYSISQNPDVQAKLHDEVDAIISS
jgi:cytochrome P450 family 4